MSMSDYHPESWNPSWSIATIIIGLQSFMIEVFLLPTRQEMNIQPNFMFRIHQVQVVCPHQIKKEERWLVLLSISIFVILFTKSEFRPR